MMAVEKITIAEFLTLSRTHPVLDVRSPGEYQHAHYPGAYSFPLFSDAERKVVGTIYKQESKKKAIRTGLSYFGKKMVHMVDEAEQIVHRHNNGHAAAENTVIVHCWRGGMRSAGVAWLLDLYGFRVYTLVGGYKVFRKWVLQQFEQTYPFRVIGGYTGSGKTEVLQAMHAKGAITIDLEALAGHKGSAFGNIGLPPQPGQEMFENMLALALHSAMQRIDTSNDLLRSIFIEDESQRIGDVNLPIQLYRQKQNSPLYFLDIPFEARLEHITREYGTCDKERLVNAILRIKKRLGGLETKTAINALVEDDIKGCFEVLLKYYDKWYGKSLGLRPNLQDLLHTISCAGTASETNTQYLMAAYLPEWELKSA